MIAQYFALRKFRYKHCSLSNASHDKMYLCFSVFSQVDRHNNKAPLVPSSKFTSEDHLQESAWLESKCFCKTQARSPNGGMKMTWWVNLVPFRAFYLSPCLKLIHFLAFDVWTVLKTLADSIATLNHLFLSLNLTRHNKGQTFPLVFCSCFVHKWFFCVTLSLLISCYGLPPQLYFH